MLSLVSTRTAVGQANCGCEAALAKDVTHSIHTVDEAKYWLEIIDDRTFSEEKDSFAESFAVPLPDVAAIVQGAVDLSHARTDFDAHYRLHTDWSRKQEAYDFFQQRTNPEAFPYWLSCTLACNQTGMLLVKQSESDKEVHLLCRYMPTDCKSAKVSGTLSGGKAECAKGVAPDGQLFPPNMSLKPFESIGITVHRTGGEMTAAVNGPIASTPVTSKAPATVLRPGAKKAVSVVPTAWTTVESFPVNVDRAGTLSVAVQGTVDLVCPGQGAGTSSLAVTSSIVTDKGVDPFLPPGNDFVADQCGHGSTGGNYTFSSLRMFPVAKPGIVNVFVIMQAGGGATHTATYSCTVTLN